MRKNKINSGYQIASASRSARRFEGDGSPTRDRDTIDRESLVIDCVGADPDIGRLGEVLSGPLGHLAMQHLRVLPRQARSVESVERMISAAADMAFSCSHSDSISIEKVSNRAGVTPQAAYRYFKDVEILIKTGLRCVVLREHELVIGSLSGHVRSDAAELAEIVVGSVIDTCERLRRYPIHMRDALLQEYVQVGCAASRLITDLICNASDRVDVWPSIDTTKFSVALMAAIAIATSFIAKEDTPIRGTRLEDMLIKLVISVIRSDGRLSDALWEVGEEFDAYMPSQIR